MSEEAKLEHDLKLIKEVIKFLGYDDVITEVTLSDLPEPQGHLYLLRLEAPEMELEMEHKLFIRKTDSLMRRSVTVTILQFTEFIGPGDGW